jgi:arylsulfatase A-like enzyme
MWFSFKLKLISILVLFFGPIAQATDRPSIIFIMADDLGFSDLGSYGSEIRTPHLDRLAENGLRFTQFYNTGRCAPTRASLLTGLYPHQAGVGRMVAPSDDPGYEGRLATRAVTVAEVLREAGYQTMVSGKWHVTHYSYNNPEESLHRPTWPLQRGFDRFFGTLSGAGSYFTPVSLMRDNEFIEPGEDFYYTDAINDEAARFIYEADADKPVFLYISHVAPHWPLHALEDDIAKYEGVYDIGWDEVRRKRYERLLEKGLISGEWNLTERDHRVPAWEDAENKEWESRRKAVYAAQIDNMDQGIGRVLEALERTGRLENTLILFFSDNGGDSSEIQGTDTRHGYFERGGTRPDVLPGAPDTYASYGVPWANVSNTPFRLYKQWNHEGGIAGPFIAHWPAGIDAKGEIRHQPAHLIDLMATALDMADAKYPSNFNGNDILPLEGVSLLPAFRDEPLDREAIYWEHIGHRAVRAGKWKLVAERNGPWELYDLEADRTETHNLAESYPEIVRKLTRMWDEWADRAYVRR